MPDWLFPLLLLLSNFGLMAWLYKRGHNAGYEDGMSDAQECAQWVDEVMRDDAPPLPPAP